MSEEDICLENLFNKILSDVNGLKRDLRTVQYDSAGKAISTRTFEGITSQFVTPSPADVELVHIDAEDIALEQAFMVVDLSDTSNWPHTNTGHIDMLYFLMTIAPDATYQGDIELGFLTNVDGENGDFNGIYEIHMDKKTGPLAINAVFPFAAASMETDHYFGPVDTNNTLFQTDVNLKGPNGNTSFPSGNGDIVMIVGRTAGEVSVGLTLGYLTQS